MTQVFSIFLHIYTRNILIPFIIYNIMPKVYKYIITKLPRNPDISARNNKFEYK
jgi:hypothetical protein